MSTVALSRNPLRSIPWAIVALGSLVWRLISRRIRTGRDGRVLQMLPDHVLADMGLERIEITPGTDGGRRVWVIPHRCC